MAVELFVPKREDGRPYWRLLYDHIADRIKRDGLKPGHIFSHQELRGLLEGSAQTQYGAAITKAAQALRESHGGTSLIAVRGQGYRIIDGVATVDQAATYKRKGQRSLRRGVGVVKSVPAENLSPGARSYRNQVERNLVLLNAAVSRTWQELDRHEHELAILAQQRVEDRTELTGVKEDVDDLRRQFDEWKRQRSA